MESGFFSEPKNQLRAKNFVNIYIYCIYTPLVCKTIKIPCRKMWTKGIKEVVYLFLYNKKEASCRSDSTIYGLLFYSTYKEGR